jgi:hypothetical protein
MLDDIQRRRFLEKPARKHLAPILAGGVLDDDLDECPGQLIGLPIGGGFACLQPDDQVADAHSLPRFQLDIA